MEVGLRYDEAVRWFDSNDLEFFEAIPRGTKPTVYVFKYTPNGRYLFLDEQGRTYEFQRASDPIKSLGSFRLRSRHADGIDALRPELVEQKVVKQYGRDAWNYRDDPWDDSDGYGPYTPPGEVCSTACYGDGVRREITQRELRNQSGEIMRALDNGDEFVVTRNGVPVGELLPLSEKRFASTDRFLEQMRGAPNIDYERFRAGLDAVIDQDPTPRA